MHKFIRVISIPPLIALTTLSIIYGARADFFGSEWTFGFSVLFLCAVPCSGYLFIREREKQRRAAMYFGLGGYAACFAYSLIADTPTPVRWLSLTYLISVVAIIVFNKPLKIRASGHACGIAGPVMILLYTFGLWGLFGILYLALIFYVSVAMKRHTLKELILGSLCSVTATIISGVIFRLPLSFGIMNAA